MTEEYGYGLYLDNPDDFVTEYAATNPIEDFAEVFAYYVNRESSDGPETVANQKLIWMDEQEELVELRAGILERVEEFENR